MDTDPDLDGYANPECYANANANGNAYPDAYPDSDANTDGNADPDPDASAYSYAACCGGGVGELGAAGAEGSGGGVFDRWSALGSRRSGRRGTGDR